MPKVFVQHKVKNFSAWKNIFDEFEETRKAKGEKSYQIVQPENDPNDVLLLVEWDNLENAKNFMNSQALKDKMKEAGVVEEPEIYYFSDYTRPLVG